MARVVGRVVMSDDEDDNIPPASEPAQSAQPHAHGQKRIFSGESDTAARSGHQLPSHSAENGPAAKRVKLTDDHVPHSPQASASILGSHIAPFADTTTQIASPDAPNPDRPPPPPPLVPFLRPKTDQPDHLDGISRGSSVTSTSGKRRRAISFSSDEDEPNRSTSRIHQDPVKKSIKSSEPRSGHRRLSDARVGSSSRPGISPKSHAEQLTGPDDSTPPHRSGKQLQSAPKQQRKDQPSPPPERKRAKVMKLTDIVQASEARSTSDPPTTARSDASMLNAAAAGSPQPEAVSQPQKRKLLGLNDLVAAANERHAREQLEPPTAPAPVSAPSPLPQQQDPKKKRGNVMSLDAILAARDERNKNDPVDTSSDPPKLQVFATAASLAHTPPHKDTIEGNPPLDESPRMARARQTTSMELEHIRQEVMGSPPPPLSAAPTSSPVATARSTFLRPRAQSNADNSPGLSLLAAVAEGASAPPPTADTRIFKAALGELAVLEDILETQPECRLSGKLVGKQSPSASLGVGPHNHSSPEQRVSLSPVVSLSSTATLPRDVPLTTRERADLKSERTRPRAGSMKKTAARDERNASPPTTRATGSKRPRQVVDSDDDDEEMRRAARPPPKMSSQLPTQQDVKQDVKQEDTGAADGPSAAPAPSKKKPMPSFKKKAQTKGEDDIKPKVEQEDRLPERKDKDKERGGDKKERDGETAPPTKKSAQPSSLPPRPGVLPPKPAVTSMSTGLKERPLPPGKESKDVNVSQFLQNILGPSSGGGASTPSTSVSTRNISFQRFAMCLRAASCAFRTPRMTMNV